MASIKFRLHSKSQNASIYLRLSLSRGKNFEKKTGLSIDAKYWSKSTGLPKQNNTINKSRTSDLRKLETYIYDELNKASSNGDEVNSYWLEKMIDIHFGRVSENGTSDLVIDCIQELIDDASFRKNGKGGVGLSKSRINAYKSLKKMILDFQGNSNYRMKDVDRKFGHKFLKHLIDEKGYAKSYAMKRLSDLKTVCNNADLSGIDVNAQFRRIESGTVKNEYIIFLNEEELVIIKDAKIDANHLMNARKWLLLGCAIGQRGGDLLNLSEDNLVTKEKGLMIELIQQKTGKYITVPLPKEIEIMLSQGFPRKISMQKFNKYIKKVCRFSGIDTPTKGKKRNPKTNRFEYGVFPKYELITSHVCRRSFASNLYGQISTTVIRNITGHSTEKMLLKYIGKSGDSYANNLADYYDSLDSVPNNNLKIVNS